MKDIDSKDHHDISGGHLPGEGGCFPFPIDYPQFPLVPNPYPEDPQPEVAALV
jgi:hypothetical protein